MGRVVDAADEGVPDAAIWLAEGGRSDAGMVVSHTDADGGFEAALTLRGESGYLLEVWEEGGPTDLPIAYLLLSPGRGAAQ